MAAVPSAHATQLPLSRSFRDYEALLVTSLTRVSSATASVQSFTLAFLCNFVSSLLCTVILGEISVCTSDRFLSFFILCRLKLKKCCVQMIQGDSRLWCQREMWSQDQSAQYRLLMQNCRVCDHHHHQLVMDIDMMLTLHWHIVMSLIKKTCHVQQN